MNEIKVHTHTSADSGFYVNSYLLETALGVIAIDTPFTVTDSRALRSRLTAIAKPLRAVLLTHAHPDHVNGTTILCEGLAGVPVIATAGVKATMHEIDAPKREFWTGIYGEDYPPLTTFPNREVINGERIEFDGVGIRVLDLGPGEGAFETVFVLEDQAMAFIGDLAYNHSHVWLAEGRSRAWTKQLERAIPELRGLQTLYPGHGQAGNSSMLEWQLAYLETYRSGVRELAAGQETLTDAAKAVLTERMRVFAPQAALSSWVALGADAVAAELLGEG